MSLLLLLEQYWYFLWLFLCWQELMNRFSKKINNLKDLNSLLSTVCSTDHYHILHKSRGCQSVCIAHSGNDGSKVCRGIILSERVDWLRSHCLLLLLFFILFCWQYSGKIPEERRSNKRSYCYDCNTDLTNDWKVKWIGWKYRFPGILRAIIDPKDNLV